MAEKTQGYLPVPFKVDDYVRYELLPNSPVMLVAAINPPPINSRVKVVTCHWFTSDGCFQKETFPADRLVKVAAPGTPPG